MYNRPWKNTFIILGISALLGGSLFVFNANSVWLLSISDTATDTRPSVDADHTVRFTTTNPIPVSGKIIIDMENGFNIPAGFDFEDVDFAVEGVQRTLAASASVGEDGVSVVTGSGGSIEITLNSTEGIGASEEVEVLLGTIASFDATGDSSIQNPSIEGTFSVSVETQNSSGTKIDNANTLVNIMEPIDTLADSVDTTPPVRSNGLPSGELPAGTTEVEISLETDELATCRYDTVAGTEYNDMTGIITDQPIQTLHSTEIQTEDGESYEFYVRCSNAQGLFNEDDFLIEFSIKPTPDPGSEPGPVGGEDVPASGGTGSGSGEAFPPDTASAVFEGRAFPGGRVTLLMDGEKETEASVGGNSSFIITLSDLTKGTKTFTVYATDDDDRKTGNSSVTFTIKPNTHTVASGIFLTPTIGAETDRVEPGDTITLSGQAFPESDVEIKVSRTGSSNVDTFQAQASSNGSWEYQLDTSGFTPAVYRANASASFEGETSDFSPFAQFGVGADLEEGVGDCGTADLNCDGAVNLVDFSILLFHWETPGGGATPSPDINSNGSVDLADFSIMLFNWTG